MSDKYNFKELKKIIADFTGDILITFPEQLSRLDKNLLVIFESNNKSNNKSNMEYKNNYSESNNDDDDDVDDVDDDDDSNNKNEELDEDILNSIEEVYNHCYKVYPERFFDILYQNEDIFNSDNNEIDCQFLPGIDFSLLWKENISDKTRENIWKYLQLVLFTIITNVDSKNTFGDTAKLFEAINEDEFKDKLEETIKGLENIFDLSNNDDFAEDVSKNIFENMPDPKEIHDHINGIMNGKLGELAKELAEETAKDFDLNEDNIKDPKDIFKTLFKNPQKLMNLVKNVGTKLDQKMKSGDIKESELLEEASNMFNNMKNVPGMNNDNMKDIFNNFNIGDLMKNMGMMPPGGKFNQNAFNSKMEETMKASRTKERMRAKLDNNRKQSQEVEKDKEQQKEGSDLDKSMKNDIQKNLDFLFNNGGGDLSKLNSDLQKLVEDMKINNESNKSIQKNECNATNKKKKKGKKA